VIDDRSRSANRDPDLDALEAFRAGNPDAFDLLVRRHEERVVRLAWRILNDPEAALDVAQESFVRAWRGASRFQGDSLFTTWLTRIVINQCRNELRRRRTVKHARPLSLDEPTGENGERRIDALASDDEPAHRHAEGHEVQRVLADALASIDPDAREVLALREVEGLSYEDMAAVLGIPVGTVRSRLHRARADLRRRVDGVLEP
jgi:RNA polymerase sigma-70 factor (ECF subfamily)